MHTYTIKTDYIGVVAGGLCILHCLATPLIFIAKSCTASCCDDAPFWWQFIDYLFLLVSFIAIYRATQKLSKHWLPFGLWLSWCALLLVILNEKLEWFYIGELLMYVPAFSIVILHLYNLKYCKCNKDGCCTSL